VKRQVPVKDLADRAKAYASQLHRGRNDVVAVYTTAREAVERAAPAKAPF